MEEKRELTFAKKVVIRNNNTLTVSIPFWLVHRLNLNKNSIVKVTIEKIGE